MSDLPKSDQPIEPWQKLSPEEHARRVKFAWIRGQIRAHPRRSAAKLTFSLYPGISLMELENPVSPWPHYENFLSNC
jgi:hypothetical protein